MELKEIVLTLDYELFGNGKGDIYQNLIRPSSRILAELRRNNIKAIWYVEGLEFNRLEKAGEDMSLVRKQINDIASNGHEIGLHLHPQWLVSKDSVKLRRLNMDLWSTVKVAKDRNVLVEALKESLDFIISSVENKIEIQRFRAGGFNACPSDNLGKTLIELNIKYDSSVVPGLYKQDNLNDIDYRNVQLRDIYPCSLNDFRVHQSDSLFLEEPIAAIKAKKIFQLSLNTLLLRLSGVAKVKSGKSKRNNVLPVDFGTMNSFVFLMALIANKSNRRMVLITHPKTILTLWDLKVNLSILLLLENLKKIKIRETITSTS